VTDFNSKEYYQEVASSRVEMIRWARRKLGIKPGDSFYDGIADYVARFDKTEKALENARADYYDRLATIIREKEAAPGDLSWEQRWENVQRALVLPLVALYRKYEEDEPLTCETMVEWFTKTLYLTETIKNIKNMRLEIKDRQISRLKDKIEELSVPFPDRAAGKEGTDDKLLRPSAPWMEYVSTDDFFSPPAEKGLFCEATDCPEGKWRPVKYEHYGWSEYLADSSVCSRPTVALLCKTCYQRLVLDDQALLPEPK
jgi:hypothetical protein